VARATIIGHVGQDPRVARFDQGGAAANFSLAVSHAVKRPDGTVESKTDWYNVVARGPAMADIVEKVIKKGQMVWVEGQIERKGGSVSPGALVNALFARRKGL
jgi:single-strand DNA-binding protein